MAVSREFFSPGSIADLDLAGGTLIDTSQAPYNVVPNAGDQSAKIQQALDDLEVLGGGTAIIPHDTDIDTPLTTAAHVNLWLVGRINAVAPWTGGAEDGMVNLEGVYSHCFYGVLDGKNLAAIGYRGAWKGCGALAVKAANCTKSHFWLTNNADASFDSACEQWLLACNAHGDEDGSAIAGNSAYIAENRLNGDPVKDFEILFCVSRGMRLHQVAIGQGIINTTASSRGGAAAQLIHNHFVASRNCTGATALMELNEAAQVALNTFDSVGDNQICVHINAASTRYKFVDNILIGGSTRIGALARSAFFHDSSSGRVVIARNQVMGRGTGGAGLNTFTYAFEFQSAAAVSNSILEDNICYGLETGISNAYSSGSFRRRGNRGLVLNVDTRDPDPGRSVTFRAAGTATWASMPAAATEIIAGVAGRMRATLAGHDQSRLVVNVGTAGAAGSVLRVQYTTDLTGATGWTTLTTDTAISATGVAVSTWSNIPAAVHAASGGDVLLRVQGQNGDGATGPAFFSLMLECR